VRVVPSHDLHLGRREETAILRKDDACGSWANYRAGVSKRSIAFDALLAVAVFVAAQAEAWTGALATHRQGPHWAQAIGYGVPALALVIRRINPLRCVVVVCATMALEFALVGSPEGFGVMTPPLIAAYTVANREERRTALWGLAIVLGLGVAWLAFDPMTVRPVQTAQGSAWLSPWVIAWLLGAYLRTRSLYVQGLVREREERALNAVTEERNRIARELHDVIGHSVSVMTVQASAVRRLMRPDQSKERAALETVEASGREALAEMRRMVGVLRSAHEVPDLTPPPTLDQLDGMFEKFRRAGLDVVFQSDGQAVLLPPGLDLTAYRLIQEALTNTLKHAHATRAVIRVSYRDDELLVSVRDDGQGLSGPLVPGNGLLGMRERVAVYGGELSVGAAEGGGFELCAELPLSAT
jgi:signal transduction histidine kinase